MEPDDGGSAGDVANNSELDDTGDVFAVRAVIDSLGIASLTVDELAIADLPFIRWAGSPSHLRLPSPLPTGPDVVDSSGDILAPVETSDRLRSTKRGHRVPDMPRGGRWEQHSGSPPPHPRKVCLVVAAPEANF
jgi:hypothetical protein